MIITILAGTPLWVWALLSLLVVLGARQMRNQVLSPWRVGAIPVALGAYSLMTTLVQGSNAGAMGWLAAWAAVATAAFVWPWPASGRGPIRWRRSDKRSDDGRAAARQAAPGPSNVMRQPLHVPGTATPLILMLSIFLVRYAATVAPIMGLAMARTTAWPLAVSVAQGCLSGLLAARAIRLFRRRQACRSALSTVAAAGISSTASPA